MLILSLSFNSNLPICYAEDVVPLSQNCQDISADENCRLVCDEQKNSESSEETAPDAGLDEHLAEEFSVNESKYNKFKRAIMDYMAKLESYVGKFKEKEIQSTQANKQTLENMPLYKYVLYKAGNFSLKFLLCPLLLASVWTYKNHQISKIFSDSEVKQNTLKALDDCITFVQEIISNAAKKNEHYITMQLFYNKLKQARNTCFGIKVPSLHQD